MKKLAHRPRWTPSERNLIENMLTDGTSLSEIVALIPIHNEAGIIREVFKTNRYSIRTLDDGTRRFYSEIKTRNRSKKEKITEAVVCRQVASIDEENVEKRLDGIISSLSIGNDGYGVNQKALDILREHSLPFEPKIVYELSEYLIRSNVKGLPCQQQSILKD